LAGVPSEWLSSGAVGFRNLPTYGGQFSCVVERDKDSSERFIAQLEGTCPVPQGGIHLSSPAGKVSSATVSGQGAEIDPEGRIVVRQIPVKVEWGAAK
jgi:hypothetical protein